jgi:hypothetical protein
LASSSDGRTAYRERKQFGDSPISKAGRGPDDTLRLAPHCGLREEFGANFGPDQLLDVKSVLTTRCLREMIMQYQLDVAIDNIGLKTIYNTGQAVTLVKSVVSNPLASGNLPIAWLEFQPFQTNLVTWIENYYAYATITDVVSGATIIMTSVTSTPVQTGWLYTFSSGQFSSSPTGGAKGVFTVINNTQAIINFGLAQYATVNNTPVFAPLNAIPVAYNQTVTFTPQEIVSIFLSSYVNNGVVISQVAGNALAITLTSQAPNAQIGFNDTNNTFYPVAGRPMITPEAHALRLA